MRALSVRRIATSAICATFLLGVTAPTAMAADTARERTRESAPASDPAALQSQVKQLATISSVVAPVTELQDAVLKAENSPLSAAELTRLGDAAKAAIAAAAATPMTPADPATPSAPGVTTPTAPLAPVAPADPATSAQVPADALQDALAALQQAVTDLVAAATSGDITGALAAVTTVSQKLAAAVLALLGGVIPGLPAIPGLPLEQPS